MDVVSEDKSVRFVIAYTLHHTVVTFVRRCEAIQICTVYDWFQTVVFFYRVLTELHFIWFQSFQVNVETEFATHIHIHPEFDARFPVPVGDMRTHRFGWHTPREPPLYRQSLYPAC